ncbi:MAG TPA: hypothetical protein DDW49_06880 [Deltaproteobacteria bacterium]|nr:hypothetical protein [Deltaproteobacteria bacterium]
MSDSTQYTVRNISPQLDHSLKTEAAKANKSLNQYLVEVLESTSNLSDVPILRHDLDFLIGSWAKDSVQDRILKEQRTIDKEMWK